MLCVAGHPFIQEPPGEANLPLALRRAGIVRAPKICYLPCPTNSCVTLRYASPHDAPQLACCKIASIVPPRQTLISLFLAEDCVHEACQDLLRRLARWLQSLRK